MAKADPSTPTSLILALHERYERIWDANNRLDEAQPAKSSLENSEPAATRIYYGCERGMGELHDESELIQQLLVRQVPENDLDATVQLMHVRLLFDGGEAMKDGDRKAIEVALTNVADFLVGEGRADMERMGRQFTSSAMHCWRERRYRDGLTELSAD